VTYGQPITADASSDRKVMTRQLQSAVRRMTAETLVGRYNPAKSAS
jgi:hypothetical protein